MRNYKRKSDRATKYTAEVLQRVVEDVSKGVITIRGASKTYNIPTTTIRDHVKKKRGLKSCNMGRSPAIPVDLEVKLADGIKSLEKWGFGLSRYEIMEIVRIFVEENNLKTPFKNNKPGEDWFLGFKKRHGLSIKKPQSVEYSRKKNTDPFIIYEYFQLLKSTLENFALLDKPNQVWNLDETAMSLDPSKTKVVGARGKPCSRTTSGPGREGTTVLAAASASGKKAPPLIIFKAKNIWNEWLPKTEIFPGTVYAASSNGWMESDIFRNYFEKSFIPTLGDSRPVLVLYDGHSTHVTASIVELAVREQITILKLPPHTSHLLQPLDLAVFKPLKDMWDRKLVAWQRTNSGYKIPKVQFSTLVAETWRDLKTDVIISGFKKGGIIPFNDQVIPEDKFEPSALLRWKQHKAAIQLQPLTTAQRNREIEQPLVIVNEPTFDNRQLDSEDKEQLVDSNEQPPTPVPSTSSSLLVSFEDLLLQKINQTKQPAAKPKRRIAGGAEVITSLEAIARMAEVEKNKAAELERKKTFIKKGKVSKKSQKISKGKRHVKKILESPSSSSNNEEEPLYIDTDDDFDTDSDFNEEVSNAENLHPLLSIEVDRWIVVQYNTKKTTRHYVGQVLLHLNKLSVSTFYLFLSLSGYP